MPYCTRDKKPRPRYKHETVLPKYIWDMKSSVNTQPELKWEIIKIAPKYSLGAKFCRLCMEEKLAIAINRSIHSLNEQTEVLYLSAAYIRYQTQYHVI